MVSWPVRAAARPNDVTKYFWGNVPNAPGNIKKCLQDETAGRSFEEQDRQWRSRGRLPRSASLDGEPAPTTELMRLDPCSSGTGGRGVTPCLPGERREWDLWDFRRRPGVQGSRRAGGRGFAGGGWFPPDGERVETERSLVVEAAASSLLYRERERAPRPVELTQPGRGNVYPPLCGAWRMPSKPVSSDWVMLSQGTLPATPAPPWLALQDEALRDPRLRFQLGTARRRPEHGVGFLEPPVLETTCSRRGSTSPRSGAECNARATRSASSSRGSASSMSPWLETTSPTFSVVSATCQRFPILSQASPARWFLSRCIVPPTLKVREDAHVVEDETLPMKVAELLVDAQSQLSTPPPCTARAPHTPSRAGSRRARSAFHRRRPPAPPRRRGETIFIASFRRPCVGERPRTSRTSARARLPLPCLRCPPDTPSPRAIQRRAGRGTAEPRGDLPSAPRRRASRPPDQRLRDSERRAVGRDARLLEVAEFHADVPRALPAPSRALRSKCRGDGRAAASASARRTRPPRRSRRSPVHAQPATGCEYRHAFCQTRGRGRNAARSIAARLGLRGCALHRSRCPAQQALGGAGDQELFRRGIADEGVPEAECAVLLHQELLQLPRIPRHRPPPPARRRASAGRKRRNENGRVAEELGGRRVTAGRCAPSSGSPVSQVALRVPHPAALPPGAASGTADHRLDVRSTPRSRCGSSGTFFCGGIGEGRGMRCVEASKSTTMGFEPSGATKPVGLSRRVTRMSHARRSSPSVSWRSRSDEASSIQWASSNSSTVGPLSRIVPRSSRGTTSWVRVLRNSSPSTAVSGVSGSSSPRGTPRSGSERSRRRAAPRLAREAGARYSPPCRPHSP